MPARRSVMAMHRPDIPAPMMATWTGREPLVVPIAPERSSCELMDFTVRTGRRANH